MRLILLSVVVCACGHAKPISFGGGGGLSSQDAEASHAAWDVWAGANLSQLLVDNPPRRYDVGLGYHARSSGDEIRHGPYLEFSYDLLASALNEDGWTSRLALGTRFQPLLPRDGIRASTFLRLGRLRSQLANASTTAAKQSAYGIYVETDYTWSRNNDRNQHYFGVTGGLFFRFDLSRLVGQ